MYQVEFTKSADKQFKKLQPQFQAQLQKTIDTLKENPRPQGYTKLSGVNPAMYRVRSGNFRIIYSIKDNELMVYLLKVGHRKEIYKK